MPWSGWFKDTNGQDVNTKVEKTDRGSKEHTLRDTGTGRNDHQHVIVHREESGRVKFAEANPNRSQRH
jgi:hypothetical protein